MENDHSQTACGACCTKLVDLGVTLGGKPILQHINLHMHCGELTVLIGPNGAGKTTLLRTLLGEVPHTGSLEFIPFKAHRRAPRVGYVPQKLEIDPLSPLSVLDLFASATSGWPLWLGARRNVREAAARSLAMVEAAHLLRDKVGELSGGQLQRVLLALALTPAPDILLLDEPLSGIDQAGSRLFYETLSDLRTKHDLAILLISHELQVVGNLADRMLFLHDRTILCGGTPWDVLADERVRATLGFDRDTLGLFTPRPAPDLHGEGREECAL